MGNMFFVLSKLLTVFIDPVFIFFGVFVGMGLGCKMTVRGRLFFILTTLLLYCASTPLVVNPLFIKLEGTKTVKQMPGKQLDAVVVLTGMVNLLLSHENSEEFGTGVDRILKGIDMVREGQADYLVISGGTGALTGPKLSESKILRKFAIRFGIAQEKILIDADSRNTRENAVHTKELLDTHQLKNIALVTSAFHLPRAMGCFRAVGLSPEPVPVDYQVVLPDNKDFRSYFPSASTMVRFSVLVHELVGIVAYGLRGYAVY